MNEHQRRVVLLIDYDNLQICASRDTPGRDLQLVPVVQLAQRYGTVILARAYAEWNLSTERLAVYKAGIEPAFAPVLRTESDRSGKSLADTVMVAEGMDMLWTLSPDVVVLATSDKDLIPLVRVAKQRGSFVVVIGSDFTAIPLREMADEHFTYRQLISDASGVATPGGPGRQPAALPEPTRRRARERTGRERAVPAAPAAPARHEPREAAAAHAAPAEPVAPVTAATSADADSQVGGRRRRRRGSRRRAERLAQVSEGQAGTEAPETDHATQEITPTTSALDVAESTVGAAEGTLAPEPAAPEAVEAAPAPRERRRRTRRTTAAVEAAAPEAQAAPTEVAPVPEQSADIPPAPEPASADGEEPTVAKRPRARRVASASRGRSRPV